jgi:hypothetical protein
MAKANIEITAVDNTRQAFESVKRNLTGLENSANLVRSTLAGIGAGLSAGAFVGFVKNSIDAADALDDVAQKSGVAVESLSALGYAAKIEGINVEDLGGSLVKLNVGLQAAANGSTEMRDAFAAVGVSVAELQNIRPDEAFLRIAESFQSMDDGAEKSARAVRLFGRAGADLIPLLNQGRDGLAAMGDEARRMGLVISSEAAAEAARFNDNLTKLSASAEAFGVAIGNIVLPSLGKFTEELLAGVKIFDGFASALFNIGFGIDPFKGLGDNLRSTRQELDALYKSLRSTPVGDNRARAFLEGRIDTYEKRLEFLKFQERQAIAESGRGGLDARDLQLQASGRRRTSLNPSALTGSAASTEAELAAGAERGARLFTQIYLDQFKILSERGREVQAGLLEIFEAGNQADARNLQETADNLDRILGGTRSGQERATIRDLEAINDALITGRINAEQYEEAYEKIQERLNDIRGVAKDTAKEASDDWEIALERMEFAVQGWGREFTETLTNMVETGKLQFSDLVQSILRDLVRMQIQKTITKPLFDAIGGALGQINFGFGNTGAPPGPGIGPGAGGGLQIRGAAMGGPAYTGQPLLVGERGPELFIPPTAGQILSNSRMGTTVVQNFTLAPGIDAGTVYRAAQMGASMAKSDIARGVRIGEIG